MIISRLDGGLGNQLFQYACGRALALAAGTELVLDGSALQTMRRKVTPRHYELDLYAVQARIASPAEELRAQRALRWGPLGAWMEGVTVLRESHRLYPGPMPKVRGDTVLAGFWQSETWFAKYAEEISQELTPRRELSPTSRRLAQSIEQVPSVAVHVRRGDYVSLKSAAQFHGTLPLTYYEAAAQRVKGRCESPRWFVFSDDIEWCRGALAFLGGDAVFVGHNQGAAAWQDLYLMSLCRHHIIANSSFSWWGAWLSEQRGYQAQMIHAPARWYVKDDPYAGHRIPQRWTRI